MLLNRLAARQERRCDGNRQNPLPHETISKQTCCRAQESGRPARSGRASRADEIKRRRARCPTTAGETPALRSRLSSVHAHLPQSPRPGDRRGVGNRAGQRAQCAHRRNGAGKSLLIDSLEFLSGARGSTEMIRAGAEKMSAEAGVEAAGGMIVKREITASGRGRVSINGSLFSVRELANAMDPILDIHGQSESHHRIAGQSYRELLDQFGGHTAILEAVSTAYREWRDAASQLEVF